MINLIKILWVENLKRNQNLPLRNHSYKLLNLLQKFKNKSKRYQNLIGKIRKKVIKKVDKPRNLLK